MVDSNSEKEEGTQSTAPSQDSSVQLLMTKVDQLQKDNLELIAAVKSLQELMVQMKADQAEFINDMTECLADIVLDEVVHTEEAAPDSPPALT